MNKQEKDLAAFEEYLFSFMKAEVPREPLNDDEVIAILKNYESTEEINPDEREYVIKLMKEAHERRTEIERKMQNPRLIRSFGELVQLFCERHTIPLTWLARLLNMPEERLEAHRKDRISPEELGRERILNFAALVGIAVQDMVAILDSTVKLLKLKSTTNFAAGHARADKGISESRRVNVLDDARKELLLALDEPETASLPNRDWNVFREELLQSSAGESAHYGEGSRCLTISEKSWKQFTNTVLQQI